MPFISDFVVSRGCGTELTGSFGPCRISYWKATEANSSLLLWRSDKKKRLTFKEGFGCEGRFSLRKVKTPPSHC